VQPNSDTNLLMILHPIIYNTHRCDASPQFWGPTG